MQHSAVAAARACRRLWLLVVVSCALGCSLDDRPSLGRYEPEPVAPSNPAMGGNAVPGLGGGTPTGAGGMGSPTNIVLVDSGQTHEAMHVPLDAGRDAQPDAMLDFDASGNDAPGCAGVYAGNFTCTPDPPVVAPSDAMMTMTLITHASQMEHVATATAPLSFSYAGFAFAGNVTGSLDCKTNEFHAQIQDGLFASEVAPIPFAFQGQIDGKLDQATRDLAGSWVFSSTDFGGSCTGTWTAKLQ